MDESPFITVLHKWISDNPIDNDNSIDNNTFNQKLNRLEFKIIEMLRKVFNLERKKMNVDIKEKKRNIKYRINNIKMRNDLEEEAELYISRILLLI